MTSFHFAPKTLLTLIGLLLSPAILAAAHSKIFTDHMSSVLMSPEEISMLPIFGLQIAQTNLRRQQNLLNDTRRIVPFGDWQGTLAVEGSDYTNGNSLNRTHFDGHYGALCLAGQKRIDSEWRIGGQLSIGDSQFSHRQIATQTNLENVGISAVATYDHDRYFANAVVQIDQVRYADIYRHTELGTSSDRIEMSDTKGMSLGLTTEMGYGFGFEGDNWRYGPKLALSIANSRVDAFSETSNTATATATAMDFSSQSLMSKKADVGVFAHYLSTDKTVTFTGKIGLANEFDMRGDDLDVRFHNLDLPSLRLPGYAAKQKTEISRQATFSYSPSAVSRVGIRYQAISGEWSANSLAINLTFHF